jgi:glycyl-tRNA synthetase beta subunit
MRWNFSNTAFSRPIRWLLALYGTEVIPFTYAGLQSSNRSRGLRFYEPQEFTVKSIDEYFSILKQQGIILDVAERQKVIREKMDEAAAKIQARVAHDAVLLEEVANEVEAVSVLIGSFDESSLELPHEVLIAVMKKHQRYSH